MTSILIMHLENTMSITLRKSLHIGLMIIILLNVLASFITHISAYFADIVNIVDGVQWEEGIRRAFC